MSSNDVVAYVILTSFNSLFEMLHQWRWGSAYVIPRPFNSLFEMPASPLGVGFCRGFGLSILYLRCLSRPTKPLKPLLVTLSILYLRCTNPCIQVEHHCAFEIAFNSLFEMPLRARLEELLQQRIFQFSI